MMGEKLTRSFYLRDTVTVARDLLGKYLVHRVDGEELVAQITETEAYVGVLDKACHSYGGKRTPRTEPMYLSGGHTYVYVIYGRNTMLNVVTEKEGNPCAVLIRGAVPVEGQDSIAKRRTGRRYIQLPPEERKRLLSGPGNLCNGMGITKACNCLDLLDDTIFITKSDRVQRFDIGYGARIGVAYAEEHANLPYRFFMIP